jgi:serine/threonine protein kinase
MNDIQCQQALPLDTMVQEYRIVRVLGVGSFGIVYIAENKFFNETVALKEFLPTDLACRPEDVRVIPLSSETEEAFNWARQKFLEEARTLRELGRPVPHRNIVRVRQFIEANDTAYMVMDYEEGKPLSQLLEERGHLPEEEVKGVLEPLLDGLVRVHAASIWHRDIKPSNILIRPDGSPVLIDFGAARRDMVGAGRSVMSVFSPAYAAPEQVYGAGTQGPWTDIYALGATLYHAITGNKPTNAAERLHGASYTSAVQAAQSDYSQAFLFAVDAALELKPEDRPQSITEWRELFEGKFEPIVAAEDDATVVRQDRPEAAGNITVPGVSSPVHVHHGPDTGLGDRILRPRPDRRPAIILIVLILATGFVFAGFMSGLIPWPIIRKSGPTLPDKETVLALVNSNLATLKCAAVTPGLSEERQLFLSGFVSSTEDLQRIRHKMKNMQGVTSSMDDLVVHHWPFCEMLSLLYEYQVSDLSPELRTKIEISKPDGRYKEGEFLSVSVTTGRAFDGYLYIDYLDSKGNILHMLPSPKRQENAVQAGQKIVIGKEEGSETSEAVYFYKIEPPHGRNLIVATTSRHPLFDMPRPHVESALPYFSALRDALRIEKTETSPTGVITAYQFFDTYGSKVTSLD